MQVEFVYCADVLLLENMAKKVKTQKQQVVLIANGDSQIYVNQDSWETQEIMEQALDKAVASLGFQVTRAHPYKESQRNGFIASAKEGFEIFAKLEPDIPIIVAEAGWQSSNHILFGLLKHKGPILTVAQWSGAFSGISGVLNLNGCLSKAGREFSTLWSNNFEDEWFLDHLKKWFETGKIKHKTGHVTPLSKLNVSDQDRTLASKLAEEFQTNPSIMGVFDEGCQGMYDALIPDELLFPLGVFKERISLSAFYYATLKVLDYEAQNVYRWLLDKGLRFQFGKPTKGLTEAQVLLQCKMYIAAVRLSARFGCDAIGIQYKPGLLDLLPASDLVEALLNNTERPPVQWDENGKDLYPKRPLTHFHRADEASGLDAMITRQVCAALKLPLESSLYEVRWGDLDASNTTPDFVWGLQSGAAPPAQLERGWYGAECLRQTAPDYRHGGGAICGLGKPGEFVWSRVFVEAGKLCMDIGRGHTVRFPQPEITRRSKQYSKELALVNAVLDGISQEQFMARHRSNHIQLVYAGSAETADKLLATKAAACEQLGINVSLCGTVPQNLLK